MRSLSSLTEARGNGRFAARPVRRIEKNKPTEGEPPALSDICADGAFCALLKCRNFHDTDQSVSAAEYDPCLGEVATATESWVTSEYDDELAHFVDVPGDADFWACMRAMSAG